MFNNFQVVYLLWVAVDRTYYIQLYLTTIWSYMLSCRKIIKNPIYHPKTMVLGEERHNDLNIPQQNWIQKRSDSYTLKKIKYIQETMHSGSIP